MKIRILLFFLLLSFPVIAKINVQEIKLGSVYYKIYSDDRINHSSIENFHENFIGAVNQLFEEYNVKMPPFFKVNLAYGAWIFKSITGRDSHTAALYFNERKEFYFQRPAALQRKGIFSNVIKHEILHCIIDNVRHSNNFIIKDKKEFFCLEEAFCTAKYMNYKFFRKKDAKFSIKNWSYEKFIKFINKNYSAKNSGLRYLAFDLNLRWGRYLLKKIGDKEFFEMIVNNNSKKLKRKRLFREFKNNPY